MRSGLLALLITTSLGCASDPTPSMAEAPEPVPEPVETAAPSAADERGEGLAAMVADVVEDIRTPEDLLLLPAGPTLLVGLDIAAFVAKPQWRTMAAQLGAREREQLRATEACGVGPDKWRRMLLGIATQGRQAAIVVEAEGVGTPATLRCLRDEIGSFTLAADAKTMHDRTGGGIVLDDNTIVFAAPRWMAPLHDRLEDRGPPAYEGALKQAVESAGVGHSLWIGMLPGPEMQSLVAIAVGPDVESISGSIDTTAKGYVLRLFITTPNALTAAIRIQAQLAVLVGLAVANSMPSAIFDTAQVLPQSSGVQLTLTATDQEVAELLTAMRGGPG